MTNKKIKRATGSYTQELVNNQPVMQQAVLRPGESSTLEKLPYKVGEANTLVQASAINPAVAAGGNSYQAYVNSGAPTTPVQMRSVVTPAQNPTVPMEGQYTRNLVKPKQMKNEVGGVETGVEVVDTGGEKKALEVEDPNSYIAALREREDSIVEQYDASVNYAKETKQDAYKKAEDQYGIAMREAQANFRANQPTYGVAAEQLLASGLTGSGYSDYLAGKAYEARTDEINAARSQQSYAQYLADQNYRDMMHQANTDKYNQQAALDQWKLDYGVQLDAEYKAKVDQVINDIINGNYSAAVAENILKNYAPNGEVSQNIINSLKAQEDQFWKINNSGVTADVMAFMMDANNQSAYLLKKYLEDSTNLTDEQIQAYIDVYFDENGKLREEIIKPLDPPKDTGDTGNTGGTGNTGNTGGTGGSANNSKDENLTDAVNYLRTKANMGKLDYASSFTAFKEAMAKHQIGNGEDYNKLINEMKQLVTQGKFDRTAAAAIEKMTGDLVVGSGAFEENRGLQKKFQKGDNFTVTVGGNSYKVDSAGEAGGDVQALASNLADGVVFGYGSELYLKSGDTAYKIKARALFGNKDYNELWKAVYGEVIDNIAKVDVSTLETDDEKLNAAKGGFVNPENKGNSTEKTNMFQNMFKDRQEATKNNAGKFFDLFKKDNISGEKLEEMAPPFTNDTLPAPDNGGNTEGGGEPAPDDGESNSTNLNIPGVSVEELAIENDDGKKYNTVSVSYNDSDGNTKTAKYGITGQLTAADGSWATEAAAKAEGLASNTVFSFTDKDGNNHVCYFVNKGGKNYIYKLSDNEDDWKALPAGTVTKGYDAKFKNDAWGFRKDLSKGDNFNIEVNGKTYRVESGGQIYDTDLIDFFEEAGIGNDEVFEYDGQAYLKRKDNYYSIDTRFLMGKQEEKLLDAIEYNPNSAISAAVNLKGTAAGKDDNGKPVEAQAFVKKDDGTGLLRMNLPDGTDKGFIELTYEEIEDKKVPSGLINEMKSSTLVDGYQDINVVYWNGNFYLNDGTYYKITPASDEYKEKLLKAMTTAENQTNNNEE